MGKHWSGHRLWGWRQGPAAIRGTLVPVIRGALGWRIGGSWWPRDPELGQEGGGGMEGLVVTSSGAPVSQGNAGPCPPARLLPLSPAFVGKIKGIDIAANNHP